ncbi:MAG: hypothetical protein LC122_13235 [Chitinophagales bacterium]|nr:hypothetical protein [Chitinophagales bacterium]
MENLRLLEVEVVSSKNINLQFSHNLITNLVSENFSILSESESVPNSKVLSLKIKKNIVYLTCQPLTPFVKYKITINNLDSVPVISLESTAKLFEDGVSNTFHIIGPIEDDNYIKNLINSYLKDSIYNIADNSTMPSTIVNSISKYLDKALDDIKNVKNENYLFFDVIDEKKVRGSGPFDKLIEGSAYEVIRVSRTETNKLVKDQLLINTSNDTLISLQQKEATSILYPNIDDVTSSFNTRSLTLNLPNQPIIKVKSITFTLLNTTTIYEYDIEKYGYLLLDNKYDDLSFKYFGLLSNQVGLNDKILLDELFNVSDVLKVDVNYLYKDLSKIPSEAIEVFSRESVSREVLQPLLKISNLSNAPIIDADNNIPVLGGAEIINVNTKTNEKHPAFLYEMEYNEESLPFAPGQYSIDYSTGTVYVFGDTFLNLGTGEYPPVVNYTYKYLFENEIDFVYDSETYDVGILPKGKAVDKSIFISFNFENVLIKDIDYKAALHEESLNERINNNLVALNVIKTQKYPVTNVFSIYNETTGENYTLSRFEDNKIYFKYINPPNVKSLKYENINFHLKSEELFVNNFITINSLSAIKIILSDSKIVSKTSNSLASFTNSSLVFEETDIFKNEKLYLSTFENLTEEGDYCVDYDNNIVYCITNINKNYYGVCTYLYNSIDPLFPHLISVDDIYELYDFDLIKTKYNYSSFYDDNIVVDDLKLSSEFGIGDSVYQINNKSVGTFDLTTFNSGLLNKIKQVYGLYEYEDFTKSSNPLNFAQSVSFLGNKLSVNSIEKIYYTNIQYSQTDGYYVEIEPLVTYKSNNINYGISVSYQGTSINVLNFVVGSTNKIILDTTQYNLFVTVSINFTINDLSRVVVDYSSGSFYVDYTYLADEILVSYEYGLNALDFRESETIKENDEYFVSYKVGALRDALITNFGTLVNIQELSTTDTTFNRERYRDALYAALSSFIKGSTIESIENIVKNIAHTTPEIKEANLEAWELGYNLLTPKEIKTEGTFELLPSKHGNGVLVGSAGQSLTLPTMSNFNLNEGTLEFWTTPQWNGIDNQSDLNFTIFYDGTVPIGFQSTKVFLGATEIHPTGSDLVSGKFTVNKSTIEAGEPNLNKDGIYIYYTTDSSNIYKWFFTVIDGYSSTPFNSLDIQIESSGYFSNIASDGYGAKFTSQPNKLKIQFSQPFINYSLNFNCDTFNYFIDTGDETSDRFSIYKDPYGYLVFRIIDSFKKQYSISKNIWDWSSGENHHIAVSWKLNTQNSQDELHLFVDGFEVPNIARYGSKIGLSNNQLYRTPSKDVLVSNKNIVGSTDLVTILGSADVTSLINFSSYNIQAGDILYIEDDRFDQNGYTIISAVGQTLTLNQNLSVSDTNLKFSVNKSNIVISAPYRYYKNTEVVSIDPTLYGSDLSTVADSNIVTSLSTDFINLGFSKGDYLIIDSIGFLDYYIITNVSTNYLELDENILSNNSGLNFIVYKNIENVLKSSRALVPDYSFININNQEYISIRNGVLNDSLIFIRSLGINFERQKKKYYLWSDNVQNIIKTQLPTPVELDTVKIYKYIKNNYIIGPSNSTLVVDTFISNNIDVDQPILSLLGRTLLLGISGTNVDFTSNVNITIDGYNGINYINEVVAFSDYLEKETVNSFTSINFIQVSGKPLNVNRNLLSFFCREKDEITNTSDGYYSPLINYSYVVNSGVNLYSDGYGIVTDNNKLFSISNIGDYLYIMSPVSVSGFYKITNILNDAKSLEILPVSSGFPLPLNSFIDGMYQILRSDEERSGLQNGFFYFEPVDYPGQPYLLPRGFYEFDYNNYLSIKFDLNKTIFIGSNIFKTNLANSIINELAIYDILLTDVRDGEESSGIYSITKDFNSLRGVKKNKNILYLTSFNEFPFTNEADFYKKDKAIKYANFSVNDNFNQSLDLSNDSLVIDNLGYLDTKKEGTIEFWVSPNFDTRNDNKDRYYFDAFGAVIEEKVSKTNNVIELDGLAEKIISVNILGDSKNYFDGGTLSYSTNDTVEEIITSSGTNKIVLKNKATQIVSVKLVNSLYNKDFFGNGTIAQDKVSIYLEHSLPLNNTLIKVIYKPLNISSAKNKQTIILTKLLPYNNTKVKITYLPSKSNGDRISLYKDKEGYFNFGIRASNIDYIIRAPINWTKNSWHRIKASWKFNSTQDNMILFMDGYRYNSVTFGSNLLFGDDPNIFGSTIVGDGYTLLGSLDFNDKIEYFTIGSDYAKTNLASCLIDNLRISNIYRPIYKFLNESIDVNYNENYSYPVVSDLYTTYLLDNDINYELFEDFTKLINRQSGLSEFTVNVFDSFNILEDNARSKEILELLIKVLKPANSRAFILYN